MEVIHMTSDFSIAVHALVYLGKNQDPSLEVITMFFRT